MVQFSSVLLPTGSSKGHEERFSRDPLSFLSGGGIVSSSGMAETFIPWRPRVNKCCGCMPTVVAYALQPQKGCSDKTKRKCPHVSLICSFFLYLFLPSSFCPPPPFPPLKPSETNTPNQEPEHPWRLHDSWSPHVLTYTKLQIAYFEHLFHYICAAGLRKGKSHSLTHPCLCFYKFSSTPHLLCPRDHLSNSLPSNSCTLITSHYFRCSRCNWCRCPHEHPIHTAIVPSFLSCKY